MNAFCKQANINRNRIAQREKEEELRKFLESLTPEQRADYEKKQFLKKAEPKEKEVDDMCEAIQGMIDEGKEEGRITILKKLVETKDISIEIAARTLGTTVEEIEIMFSKIQ